MQQQLLLSLRLQAACMVQQIRIARQVHPKIAVGVSSPQHTLHCPVSHKASLNTEPCRVF